MGVPALFFTTLLHEDYHTPFDNPDRIDIAKLTRMTKWMHATGRAGGRRQAARGRSGVQARALPDYTGTTAALDSSIVRGSGARGSEVRGSTFGV